jgi:hypothetical protein
LKFELLTWDLINYLFLLLTIFKSFLESNLTDLYKKLIRLKESLKTMKTATASNEPSNNKPDLITRKEDSLRKLKLLPFHSENLSAQLDACISSTKESCDHLFDLSLIVPSAPWVLYFATMLLSIIPALPKVGDASPQGDAERNFG